MLIAKNKNRETWLITMYPDLCPQRPSLWQAVVSEIRNPSANSATEISSESHLLWANSVTRLASSVCWRLSTRAGPGIAGRWGALGRVLLRNDEEGDQRRSQRRLVCPFSLCTCRFRMFGLKYTPCDWPPAFGSPPPSAVQSSFRLFVFLPQPRRSNAGQDENAAGYYSKICL